MFKKCFHVRCRLNCVSQRGNKETWKRATSFSFLCAMRNVFTILFLLLACGASAQMSKVDSLLKQYPHSSVWLYQYNDTMISSQTYFDSTANIVAFYTFTHDSIGKISQRLFYVQDDSISTIYNLWQTTNYIFDEKKNSLQVISFEGDGNAIDDNDIYYFIEDKNISKVVHVAPRPKVDKYAYNVNKKLIQITSNYSKITEDYTYNEDGLMSRITSMMKGVQLDATEFTYDFRAGNEGVFALMKSAKTLGANNEWIRTKLFFYNNERDKKKVKLHFIVEMKNEIKI